MKTNCDIIRDLLPLYAEHITSEATNALVEEHLAECEACRAELEQMEQPVPVRPEAQPDAPLRRIRAALQRRSFRAAIGSVLAALCALAMIFWMGTARVPATTEQAHFWTYNRKENGADICILEVQGEGVWLDMEGTFSWGKPQITVRAMRYRFPGVHRVLTALVDSDRSTVWVMVSRTQLLTVDCADQTLYYRDGQLVDRYIVQENPDGTFDYAYGTDQTRNRYLNVAHQHVHYRDHDISDHKCDHNSSAFAFSDIQGAFAFLRMREAFDRKTIERSGKYEAICKNRPAIQRHFAPKTDDQEEIADTDNNCEVSAVGIPQNFQLDFPRLMGEIG